MPIITLDDTRYLKYDYIIVGGGTSGLVLAARLTENPKISVLVVEAGSHHECSHEIDIPGLVGRAVGNPKYDWMFTSVPQKFNNGRVIRQPRGKGLGGSSLINYLGMFRPSKEECDALELTFGNQGWNWESLSYYMKKSEKTFFQSKLTVNEAKAIAVEPVEHLHGTEGPLIKSLPPSATSAQMKLFDSAEALGISKNPDTCSGKTIGAMTAFASVNPVTAIRTHSANSYLTPNLERSNLQVLIDAHVTKILLRADGEGLKQAMGVEVFKDGTFSKVEGAQRIIISAGSIQTPQILELSGVGNPDILSKHGIDVAIDLPGVGENLQDHVGSTIVAELQDGESSYEALMEPECLKKEEELYKNQGGLLAFGPVPSYIFLPANTFGTKEYLDSWEKLVHIQCSEGLAKCIPSLRSGLEKQYSFLRKLFLDSNQAQAELMQYLGHPRMPSDGKRYTSLVGALLHPFSRGAVHISSSDPLEPPAIDPNYFSNEIDLDILARIVLFAVRLNSTPPLSNIIKSQIIPAKDTLDGGIASVKECVKSNSGPVFHPIGTAAMLPRCDGGVVDSCLKVYGTNNLYIADLSILPLELSCHTQAMAYAIGEKAADILKSSKV